MVAVDGVSVAYWEDSDPWTFVGWTDRVGESLNSKWVSRMMKPWEAKKGVI
jgi:hypothetical protein